MDVYEVICKIVHLTVQTLSYVNRYTSGPLRPPSRSAAELRTMPEVSRQVCLELSTVLDHVSTIKYELTTYCNMSPGLSTVLQ